jgi:hypothetical protein
MKCVLRAVNVVINHTELYIHISLMYAASGDVLNCPLPTCLSSLDARSAVRLQSEETGITGGFHSNTLTEAAEYCILKLYIA